MELADWIEQELRPRGVPSTEFIYDDMDSQSGRALPIIYLPFDPSERSHWQDRGCVLDFLSNCGTGRLLDFGPGDGWPSLPVAPFVREVIGVDASLKRVAVCQENAARLGIQNTLFLQAGAAAQLPFPDQSFDGIMAASSIEQTPDPEATLMELARVLTPGGRLRLTYEELGKYRNGREQEACVWPLDEELCILLIYFRDIVSEQAVQYGLTLSLSCQDTEKLLFEDGSFDITSLNTRNLRAALPHLRDVRKCILRHPSGGSYARMLAKAGFSEILPSHNGSIFAGKLFDSLPEKDRPDSLSGVDDLLKPLIDIVCKLEAPIDNNPWLTAVK